MLFCVFVYRLRLLFCWCWGAETDGCLLTRAWSSTRPWRAELRLSGILQRLCRETKTCKCHCDCNCHSSSPSRLLWFPEDGHSLSRADTQADCFLNTALWLQQHLWPHKHAWTDGRTNTLSSSKLKSWTCHCLFLSKTTLSAAYFKSTHIVRKIVLFFLEKEVINRLNMFVFFQCFKSQIAISYIHMWKITHNDF